MTHEYYMMQALKEARQAYEEDEIPIGAVVVLHEKVIARGRNMTEKLNDPTAHAEMIAIRQATRLLGNERLIDCDLYVTLEPCTMCAAAISLARIRRLYYGAADPKAGAVEHGVQFFSEPGCLHRPEIYGGIGEREAATLLQSFFRARRP